MRVLRAFGVACLMAAPVCGQALYQPPAAIPDLSGYATASSVTSAIAAASPPACGILSADTLNGNAGTGAMCTPRVDSSRPTVVQALTVTTTSTGDFSGTWPTPFAFAPTGRFAVVDVASGSTAPYFCSFNSGSVTATTFAGHCWQIVASTLPTTSLALLGLVVSPLSNAAAGLTVRVTGRQ